MQQWQEILSAAKELWFGNRLRWRDARLKVGGLLHEYMVLRLREEADHLHIKTRQRKGCTRQAMIAHAGKELSVSLLVIRKLVQTAQVVNLLGPEVGSLTYSTLTCFCPLMARPLGTVDRCKDGTGLLPSQKEQWKLLVGIPEGTAKFLFQQVVKENWQYKQTQKAVQALLGVAKTQENELEVKTHTPFPYATLPMPTNTKPKYCQPRGHSRTVQSQEGGDKVIRSMTRMEAVRFLRECAARGTPKDVAEMVLDLVKENKDPNAVTEHLTTLVRKLPIKLSSTNT